MCKLPAKITHASSSDITACRCTVTQYVQPHSMHVLVQASSMYNSVPGAKRIQSVALTASSLASAVVWRTPAGHADACHSWGNKGSVREQI